jgi:hypothetical protein
MPKLGLEGADCYPDSALGSRAGSKAGSSAPQETVSAELLAGSLQEQSLLQHVQRAAHCLPAIGVRLMFTSKHRSSSYEVLLENASAGLHADAFEPFREHLSPGSWVQSLGSGWRSMSMGEEVPPRLTL